jgi:hypothetical protein
MVDVVIAHYDGGPIAAALRRIPLEALIKGRRVGARLLGCRPQAVRHLWEAGRLGVGESDVERMRFPLLSLREAIQRFTEAVYGHKLDFEHA